MRNRSFLLGRLLLLLLGVLLPLLLLHGYTLFERYNAALARADESVLTLSRDAAQDLNRELQRAESILELLANREEIQSQTPADCQALLQGLSALDPVLDTIAMVDVTGTLKCTAVGAAKPLHYADMAWFQQASNLNGFAFQGPTLSKLRPTERIAVLSKAVRKPGKGTVGIIALSINLERLSSLIAQDIPGQEAIVAVVNNSGIILARHPDAALWVGKAGVPEVVVPQRHDPNGILRVRAIDNVVRLFAAAPVGRYDLRVVAGISADLVESPLRAELQRSLIVSGITLLALTGIAVLAGRKLVQPLRVVIKTLQAQSEGNTGLRVSEDLPGEYRIVAHELNRLTDSREAAEASARRAQRRAERISDVYATLAGLHLVIAKARTPQELYEAVCRLCVTTQHATAAWVGLAQAPVTVAAAWAGLEGPSGKGNVTLELEPERWSATNVALQNGKSFVDNDYLGTAPTVLWRDRAFRNNIRSAGAFPFRQHDRVAGVLNLYYNEIDVFDETLTGAVEELTREISFALENLTRDAVQLQSVEALRKRELQLAAIIDNASDAIFTVDTNLCVQVFNSSAAHLFRIKPEDAQGELITRFLPDCANHPEGPFVHGATRQLRAVRTDGVEFPAEMSISVSGQGRGTVATIVLRDLTRIRDAQAAQLARQKADAANQAKNQFIARMSHELRTPLNAVLGFSQLLHSSAREKLTDIERRQLDMVFLAGAQLRALIDDVLDVSRLEAGTLAMDLQEVELSKLLLEAIRLSEPDALSRSVTITANFDLSQPVTVLTDAIRVRQVLSNLLSNAIKYNNPGGRIALSLVQLPTRVEVVVSDTGMGMSPQQVANIFQPFNRLGRERSDIEGTGIGMSICRQIVELLGGSLTVESELGKGTLVTLCLTGLSAEDAHARLVADALDSPLPKTIADPLAAAADVTGVVLYIEDNPVNALLVEQVLQRWPGVTCLIAEDGASGLSGAAQASPDLVLLDMNLPDMTGLEVLAQLKQREVTRHLPVVALSASAMETDIQDAMTTGATEYWTKPIDFQPFLAGIQRLLAQGRKAATPASPDSAEQPGS